jgi:GNAT superfamily N-acetyltransferase
MERENAITVRDAEEADVSVLAAIRSSEAHHRGRLRDAQSPDFRYFALWLREDIIGFVCLVFRRPESWANAADTEHLPQVVDLYIGEEWRGQGTGSEAMRLIERMAEKAGATHLYISVEPIANPRAYALYQRLGYQRIQTEPYFHHWQAVNADGTIEQGKSWLVDMVKTVAL